MQRRVAQQGPDTRYLENVCHRLGQCIIHRERYSYELGRLVDEIMTGEYWCRADWPGSPEGGWPKNDKGFKAWCMQHLGFKDSKARYLRRIYINLAAMELPENGDTFARCMRLGWTKLDHVLRVAKDAMALEYWLNRIDNENLNETKLKGEVAIAQGKGGDEGDDAAAPAAAQTDPAAMPSGGADARTKDDNTLPPGAVRRAARVEWTLSFERADDARTFIKALDIAKARMGTDSNGEAALRLALYYMTNHPQDDEGGEVMEVEELLRGVERTGGIKIVKVEDAKEPGAAA